MFTPFGYFHFLETTWNVRFWIVGPRRYFTHSRNNAAVFSKTKFEVNFQYGLFKVKESVLNLSKAALSSVWQRAFISNANLFSILSFSELIVPALFPSDLTFFLIPMICGHMSGIETKNWLILVVPALNRDSVDLNALLSGSVIISWTPRPPFFRSYKQTLVHRFLLLSCILMFAEQWPMLDFTFCFV